MNDMKNIVSITRRQGALTPHWLLEQLAKIDAVLIFKFANQTAHIAYDIPNERAPRDEYLCNLFNAAPEDFKQEYIAIIWDFIGLPRNECPINVSKIHIPLSPIFSWNLPNCTADAAAYTDLVRESLDEIPAIVEFGSWRHVQRIMLEAMIDRLSRT